MMHKHRAISSESKVLDLGSGIGKPPLHFAVNPGVQVSIGLELLVVRFRLSMFNLQEANAGSEEKRIRNCMFVHGDGMRLRTLEPFGLLYMFDIGMPPALMIHLAGVLGNSPSVKHVLSYHNPDTMIGVYSYPMVYVEGSQTSCSMHGSGEGKTAYLYRVVQPAAAMTEEVTEEGEEEGRCDPIFSEALGAIMDGQVPELIERAMKEFHVEPRTARARAGAAEGFYTDQVQLGGKKGGEDVLSRDYQQNEDTDEDGDEGPLPPPPKRPRGPTKAELEERNAELGERNAELEEEKQEQAQQFGELKALYTQLLQVLASKAQTQTAIARLFTSPLPSPPVRIQPVLRSLRRLCYAAVSRSFRRRIRSSPR